MNNFLFLILQTLILAPAGVLVYMPVANNLKIKKSIYYLIGTALIVVLVPLTAILQILFNLSENIVLTPVTILIFLVYHFLVNTTLIKKIFIFLTAIAIISFFSSVSYYTDALLHPQNTYEDFSLEATLIQLGLCTIFTLAAAPFLIKHCGWLINNFNDTKIWILMSLIPVGITVISFTLVPYTYSNVFVGKIKEFYMISYAIIFLFSIFAYTLFFQIAKSIFHNTELEKSKQLLELQANQYDTLMEHVEEMRKVRHDFRQQLRVLSGLAQESNDERIQEYISTYMEQVQTTIPQYCDNSMLNSLIAYYKQIADLDETIMDISIKLPKKLPINEVDFCSSIGNLLENAVLSSRQISPENRHITIKIANTNEKTLAIKTSNAYNGNYKKIGNRFISTRHKGLGIGLESVKATVTKYNGIIKIDTDNNIFAVSILLFC